MSEQPVKSTKLEEKSKLELFFIWLWLALLLSGCLIAYPPMITAIADRQECDTVYDLAQPQNTQAASEQTCQSGSLYRDCCKLLAKPGTNVCTDPEWTLSPANWGANLYYELVKLKPTALVLLMVTISGIMGSTIHLCRRFFGFADESHPERVYTLRWYLLRPFSGAITAVALFVLVMSGQMAFSQSNEDSLSPYLISFIALIGGFLSIQAQDRIKQAGVNFLRGKSDRQQSAAYATDIFRERLSQLETNGQTAERLCANQAFSLGELKAWRDGKKPVPRQYQPVFAAWMDTAIEELFNPKAPQQTDKP